MQQKRPSLTRKERPGAKRFRSKSHSRDFTFTFRVASASLLGLWYPDSRRAESQRAVSIPRRFSNRRKFPFQYADKTLLVSAANSTLGGFNCEEILDESLQRIYVRSEARPPHSNPAIVPGSQCYRVPISRQLSKPTELSNYFCHSREPKFQRAQLKHRFLYNRRNNENATRGETNRGSTAVSVVDRANEPSNFLPPRLLFLHSFIFVPFFSAADLYSFSISLTVSRDNNFYTTISDSD